jgi:hypothetical protein
MLHNQILTTLAGLTEFYSHASTQPPTLAVIVTDFQAMLGR